MTVESEPMATDIESSVDMSLVSELVRKADLVTPMTIRAAVRTGLVDALASGEVTPAVAAALIGGDPRAVTVVLAHLYTEGLVTREDEAYSLTTLGRLLTEGNAELGLRDLMDSSTVVGRNESALTDLHHTILTGRPASEFASGHTLWEELDADSVDPSVFDWKEPGFAAELILESAVWAGARTVLDLGGNTGSLMLALLASHPHLAGAVLDFPVFTSRALTRAAEAGLGDRLHTEAGSFFDALPSGYDVYLLSAVLADWNDDDAVTILRRAAEAAGPNGVVVVAEVHLASQGTLAPITSVAVRLEASVTRPDRRAGEVAALIERAGLVVVDADTARADRSLFVARPLS